jgi:hypothetical protein
VTRPAVAVVQLRIDAEDAASALARLAHAAGAAGVTIERIAMATRDDAAPSEAASSGDYDSGGW